MPKIPNNSRKSCFFAWPDDEQDQYLMRVADEAATNVGKRAPDLRSADRGAEEEATLRDVAETLFLLGGARTTDLDFLFSAPPDGSRVKGLERTIGSLLWSASPANRMATSPTLIDHIVADIHAMGVVGERNLALALYTVATSRLLDNPVSAKILGGSSSGKSYSVNKVKVLMPPESVLDATSMSPQSLYYGGDLRHKFVVSGERAHRRDDEQADATAALRQLQSEGRISKYVTESKDGKMTTRHFVVEGPIAHVETTTLDLKAIFSEDSNRTLILRTDESEAHTKAVLQHSAKRYEGGQVENVSAIVAKHHDFQRSLRRYRVVIPFAGELVNEIPANKIEARRVGQQILSIIEAIALLHQHQRERDSQGRLVATLHDYEVAKSILVQPVGESLGVPASPARFYTKLATAFPGGHRFTTKDAQKVGRDVSESSVKNWLRVLATHECVEQVEAAKGPRPAVWRLTGKTPEQAVLPDLACR